MPLSTVGLHLRRHRSACPATLPERRFVGSSAVQSGVEANDDRVLCSESAKPQHDTARRLRVADVDVCLPHVAFEILESQLVIDTGWVDRLIVA